jgi:DMSO/TMAO reductase YedYZ molybdopterin-dependent catalytic subunit
VTRTVTKTVTKTLRRLLHAPLPKPADALRRGPFRPGRFASALRTQRSAAWLGLWLGIAFGVCFITGFLSHAIQQPPSWFYWPSRPVNLYWVTQGLHVATGLACVPLLLAKLWVAYPRLYVWPPAKDVAEVVSRAAVLVLVASSLFQIGTGLLNIARWYEPLGFYFTVAHYWTAWLAIGALLVHIGARLDILRRVLRSPDADQPLVQPVTPQPHTMSRRAFVSTVGAAVGVVTVATVGQTITPLAPISLLAPRRPDMGSQGLPVNRSAVSAGVLDVARDPAYRLSIEGPHRLELSLAELRGLPQHTVQLPIICVEGWSAQAWWTGVRIRDLLDEAGFDDNAELRVTSLQPSGLYRTSRLVPPHARDPLTLLALQLNGSPLDLDHGFPCRLIAPNRPGVMQTKWVASISRFT